MAQKCHRQRDWAGIIFVVEQFWGRAARASWTRKSLGALVIVWAGSLFLGRGAIAAIAYFRCSCFISSNQCSTTLIWVPVPFSSASRATTSFPSAATS